MFLDAFRGRLDVEASAEAKHGADDLFLAFVVAISGDEAFVDLDLVEAVAGELGEARIASAEIVEGDLDAGGMQLFENNGGDSGILYQRVFGNLNFKALWRQRLAERTLRMRDVNSRSSICTAETLNDSMTCAGQVSASLQA